MGDALGEVDVARFQVDIEGDQEGSGADSHGTRSRVHACGSIVGLPTGMRDLGPEPLVLRFPDVGQDDPLGARGGLGIEVDGQLEALGDMGTEAARQLDALLHGRLAERHEGDDVDGPDAWVLALVLLHVDPGDGDLDRRLHRHRDGLGLTGEGQHAPVMVDIRRPVEEVDVRRGGHGGGQRVDDLGPASLAEVGDALDQLCHGRSVRAAPLSRAAPVRRRAGPPPASAAAARPAAGRGIAR